MELSVPTMGCVRMLHSFWGLDRYLQGYGASRRFLELPAAPGWSVGGSGTEKYLGQAPAGVSTPVVYP